jgi:hypothetical protein
MNKSRFVTLLAIFIGLILTGCSPVLSLGGVPIVYPSPVPQTASREAQVQSVQLQVSSGEHPQVNAVVRGNLSESCAVLGQSEVQAAGNTFQIKVLAVSLADRGCAPAVTPFETTIPLNTAGLPAGTYTVIANGASAVFTVPPAVPTPTVVPPVAPAPQACTDRAAFIADVSIPDGFVVAPNTPFTKMWRLKNTGSCAWDSNYQVFYMAGANMTRYSAYKIVGPEERVEPGQSVDISVGMTAPANNGVYTSYWGLKGRYGEIIPIQGGAGGNSFFVKIKVDDGSMHMGRIVHEAIQIDLEQGSGTSCTPDATYLVHAYITADGPLSAHYRISSSTSGQVPAGFFVGANENDLLTVVDGIVDFDPVLFEQGGTRTITVPLRFVGPYAHPDDITVRLVVAGGASSSVTVYCE